MITRLVDGLRRFRDRAPGRVTVAYEPKADGHPDPGEVVWTWVAYEDDPSQGKDRPVVIIGRLDGGLAAVALTSKDHGESDRIPVGTGAWDPEHRPSFAKVDRLLVVDPSEVRREGSSLDRARFEALVAEVRRRHPDRLIPATEPAR